MISEPLIVVARLARTFDDLAIRYADHSASLIALPANRKSFVVSRGSALGILNPWMSIIRWAGGGFLDAPQRKHAVRNHDQEATMGSKQSRAMAGSCLGTLLGLFLGGLVGFCLYHFRVEGTRAGAAEEAIIWAYLSMASVLLGVFVGGMIGAGLATRDNSGAISTRAPGDSPPRKEKPSDHASDI